MIDHWWQTETGWAIAANCLGIERLPVKPGSPTKAVPGYDVRVLDEDGHGRGRGEIGNIVVRLPLPPGMLADAVAGRRALRRARTSRAIRATT